MRGALTLALMLLAAPASAQTEPGELEARALFEAGQQAVAERRLEDARQLFERSLEVHPTPAAAFNAAVVAQDLGDHAGAAQRLDRLLDGRYGELPAERADAVRRALEQSTAQVATLELSSEDPYLDVRLDGEPTGTGVHYVQPGAHTLTVQGADRPARTRQLDLAAGERRTFDLVLEVTVQDAVRPPERDRETGEEPGEGPDVGLIVGLTVGALLLVGAGVGIGVGVAVSQPPADIVANGQTLRWRLP